MSSGLDFSLGMGSKHKTQIAWVNGHDYIPMSDSFGLWIMTFLVFETGNR